MSCFKTGVNSKILRQHKVLHTALKQLYDSVKKKIVYSKYSFIQTVVEIGIDTQNGGQSSSKCLKN